MYFRKSMKRLFFLSALYTSSPNGFTDFVKRD